ncbi:MAG: FxsA family protein [Cycloclasticus sp.]|nr:exlusion protein FxsA [Cycloclasticus sp. 44_32_T64]
MNPFSIFLLLLIVVPVVEIYFLIQVGSVIGAFSTVVLILVTAVLGAYLFRLQGLITVQRIQASLSRGEIPAIEMLEGAMLLVSGALLLTPGFVTDVIGFLCLVPGLRRRFALSVIESRFINQSSFSSGGPFQKNDHESASNDNIIEGEFKREDESEISKKDD